MPSSNGLEASRHGVLAVVVVYERELAQVAPWTALCAAMDAGTRAGEAAGGLVLERVLVYDNSTLARVRAADVPAWGHVVHDPANGGTAAAYRCALKHAEAAGVPWMLLLDDDTQLPPDLLAQASAALRRSESGLAAAALLPRVRHGSTPVSPARITLAGSIRPLQLDEPADGVPALTGVASGALVKVQALRAIGPLPAGLWLDYVDHWLFACLRRQGHRLLVSDAVLDHDLSIHQPKRLSARRLDSVLNGEAIFTRSLAWPARWLSPLRLLWRALRASPLGLAQRFRIVGQALRGTPERLQ